MIPINYPEPSFRTRKEGSRELIFDGLRKRWVVLTPEEWVRQNFLRYLMVDKGFPATMLAIEKEMRLGELRKRFDILVYNPAHQPWMMVECKAAGVSLDNRTLDQLLRYNMAIPVSYLIITNGISCFGFSRISGTLAAIDDIPDWGS
jgi:hypothetical protein